MDQLIEGYRRFRDTGWTAHRQRLKDLAADGQKPQALIVACSDSRADPAMVFDADPGEIFVVRNIAAMVPPFETNPGLHGVSAALEFAVQFLKVEEIVVMGHGLCGGCHAALHKSMEGAEPGRGGFIADWIGLLDEASEAVRAAHPQIDNREAGRAMEMAAVRVSLANLRTFPCIEEKEKRGSLKLRGAFFAIGDGILHVMDEATGEFAPA